ncbi:MAG: anti-sigma factor antagonist [Oscillospiraceae bacterium]|nr:anti-sigma factor antagonist [Oscillospiraceae bacterium]
MGTAEITNNGERLIVALSGEIDHHSLKTLRGVIDVQLENYTPRLLVLDFREVGFMDSSGIGLILGRRRIAESYGGKVVVKNVSGYVEKLIKLAGLGAMISKQQEVCRK